MFTALVIALIAIVNGIYAVFLFSDSFRRRDSLKSEKGHPLFLALYTCAAHFMGTFGLSDFAISVVVYRKLHLVEDPRLPGTLNTQCTIPVAVMAFAYISAIEVNRLTLIVCVLSQICGTVFGSKYVSFLNPSKLKMCMSAALLGTAFLMLAGKLGIIPGGGDSIGLTPGKLAVAAILIFIFGALNMIGFGSFAPTMATVYALGLSPVVAFPLMMVSSSLSLPMGSIKFVKSGNYSIKIAILSSVFGVLGVLIAIYFVKALDPSLLQWIMILIIAYTSVSVLLKERKAMANA